MKIAPKLRTLMQAMSDSPPQSTMREEYRALVAVARAADKWADTSPSDATFEDACVRVCRALARLERVSRSKP